MDNNATLALTPIPGSSSGRWSDPLPEVETALLGTIARYPSDARAWRELANVRWRQGDMVGAAEAYGRLAELQPDAPGPLSDYLHLLLYDPRHAPEDVFRQVLAWADRYARPLYPADGDGAAQAHPNHPDPDRPLRVGYVSGDFREYPVSRFIGPALEHHDRSQFTVFCYSHVAQPDDVTRRLRTLACAWRETRGLGCEELAAQVRRDGIDVLVDLTGHLGTHRLQAFARRPAPVQVNYVGWPATTGVATIGYRITDSFHDPPGLTERYHTEELVRLDPCCWCYDPGRDAPDVSEPPVQARRYFTFACLNRLVKVTPQMLRLWARIVNAVPGSKLLFLIDPGCVGDPALEERIRAAGLHPKQVILATHRSRAKYLELFGRCDLLLDTSPYAGMTTTCDGLWMGVPTVTLAGRTHVSRVGVSLLNAVGLPELVANTEEEYVQIAVGLAKDEPRLAEMRRGLRERMQSSPLRDGEGLTRRLEAAYRQMWRTWCAGEARR